MKLQNLLLRELEPDVDSEFGQAVCCDILPKYISDVSEIRECYGQVIGLAYDLADSIAQLQLDKIKKHIEGKREEIARRYMVQCEKGEPFECPHLEDCKHPDCDICQWQLDEADQIIALFEEGK